MNICVDHTLTAKTFFYPWNKNLYIIISSVESQKGVIAVQRCSIENQKGAIAVQSLWR